MQSILEESINERSDVIEAKSWQDIPDVSQHTLAAYDIDDTYITTVGIKDTNDIIGEVKGENTCAIGSDLWFRDCYHRMKNERSDHNEAKSKAVKIFDAVQQFAIVKLVEPEAKLHFDRVKENGFGFLGITARGDALAEVTYKNLTKHGIDFRLDGTPSDYSFDVEGKPVLFSNNILYCNGANKGSCLDAFRETEYGEKLFAGKNTLLFVDDSLRNCKDVVAAATKMNVGCRAVHYTHVKNNYNYDFTEKDRLLEERLTQPPRAKPSVLSHHGRCCSTVGMFAKRKTGLMVTAAAGIAAAGLWLFQ